MLPFLPHLYSGSGNQIRTDDLLGMNQASYLTAPSRNCLTFSKNSNIPQEKVILKGILNFKRVVIMIGSLSKKIPSQYHKS